MRLEGMSPSSSPGPKTKWCQQGRNVALPPLESPYLRSSTMAKRGHVMFLATTAFLSFPRRRDASGKGPDGSLGLGWWTRTFSFPVWLWVSLRLLGSSFGRAVRSWIRVSLFRVPRPTIKRATLFLGRSEIPRPGQLRRFRGLEDGGSDPSWRAPTSPTPRSLPLFATEITFAGSAPEVSRPASRRVHSPTGRPWTGKRP